MQLKNRILCLDIGEKRIGVAITDPFGLFACELGLVLRQKEKTAVEEIKNYCKLYNVKTIVAGLPYNMDGTLGIQAKKTVEFMKNFSEFEIKYQDERLSSYTAEEILKAQKKRYTKNKGLVDVKSACIILQSYLGEQNG